MSIQKTGPPYTACKYTSDHASNEKSHTIPLGNKMASTRGGFENSPIAEPRRMMEPSLPQYAEFNMPMQQTKWCMIRPMVMCEFLCFACFNRYTTECTDVK